MTKRIIKHKYGTRSAGAGQHSYAQIAKALGYNTPSGARYQFYVGLRKLLDVFIEYNDLDLTKEQEETLLRSEEFHDIVREAIISKDNENNE